MRFFRNGERGQSMVEFAFCMVGLLTMTFATIDFGRAVFDYTTITEVAREGARYASVRGVGSASPVGPVANNANVQTAARSIARVIPSGNITVNSSWPDGNNNAGSRVTVSASYRYNSVVGTLLPFSGITLTSSSTMVIVY